MASLAVVPSSAADLADRLKSLVVVPFKGSQAHASEGTGAMGAGNDVRAQVRFIHLLFEIAF
jgi:hypothetical protein